MDKNNSARNSLIIAAVILAVTASFFTVSYVRTKQKIENFNAVLGKDEKPSFSQIIQTIFDNKEFGTTEENVRYASLDPRKDIIEIKEKMFIAQVNDVYLNADDYMGKTIKLEGVFKETQHEDGEDPYYFVVRYGPNCCGNDGVVGFEVAWAKEKAETYPNSESWVEAEGVLNYYEESGYKLSYIDLSSLNVLSKRGAETVLQ